LIETDFVDVIILAAHYFNLKRIVLYRFSGAKKVVGRISRCLLYFSIKVQTQ